MTKSTAREVAANSRLCRKPATCFPDRRLIGPLQQRNFNWSHFNDEETEVQKSSGLLKAPARKAGIEALLGHSGVSHTPSLVVPSLAKFPAPSVTLHFLWSVHGSGVSCDLDLKTLV